MALTLDSNLLLAQQAQTRRPLLRITSSQKGGAAGFNGTVISSPDPPAGYYPGDVSSWTPAALTLASGRLLNVYILGPASYEYGYSSFLEFNYTNLDRSQFFKTEPQLMVSGPMYPEGLALCELTDGNVGVVWSSTCNLEGSNSFSSPNEPAVRAAVLSPEGVPTVAFNDGYNNIYPVDIYAPSSTTRWMSRPAVATLGADSYVALWFQAAVTNELPSGDFEAYISTSSDFVTWTAPQIVYLGVDYATQKIDNPYLFMAKNGTLELFFDYNDDWEFGGDIRNIYRSTSSNGGSTWTTPVRVTNYTTNSQIGMEPAVVEKVSSQFTMAYTERTTALRMNSSSGGVSEITYDAENGKIYVTEITGGGALACVSRIDVATWTKDAVWDDASTPSFPNYFFAPETHYINSGSDHGDGCIIPVAIKSSFDPGFPVCMGISVLNGDSSSITNYFFTSSAIHGITQNVTWSDPAKAGEGGTGNSWIRATQVDKANNRLYVLLACGGAYRCQLTVGYIDLTESPSPNYTFHQILTERDTITEYDMLGNISFIVDPVNDWIVYAGDGAGIGTGRVRVWVLSAALLARALDYVINPIFPYYGLQDFVVVGDTIYGKFKYQSAYSQDTYRGICQIDILTGIINYHRPTFASVDDYGMQEVKKGDGGTTLLIPCSGYGFAAFDTISTTWILYNDSNTPGLSGDITHAEKWTRGAWNSVDERFVGGYELVLSEPVIMFDPSGHIDKLYSMVSNDNGSTWSAKQALTQGTDESFPAVATNPDLPTAMYVFWQRDNVTYNSIVWDSDVSATGVDISNYVTDSDDVVVTRSIDGNPSKLSFSVAEGHLFDPYNTASLLSVVLQKGRLLVISFGEDYYDPGTGAFVAQAWQPVGSFIITESKISYEFGKYSTMEVVAEDERTVWGRHHVYATDIYSAYPEVVLEDALKEHASLPDAQINISNFDNRVVIEHQWVETTLEEIVKQICSRFGYFPRFDVDNVFTCRKIAVTNAIDHDYSADPYGSESIIRYEPDDAYSDFTNRVTVTGQERTFIDVIYPEERIDTLNGHFGWYGYKQEFEVAYSKDYSRTCKNPRLVVKESTKSYMFQLMGNTDEAITYEDTVDYKYCIVTVTAPNLTWELLAAIGLWVGGHFIPDWTSAPGSPTIPVGRITESVGCMAALMILGSIGNYQLEVWATPTGQVRRSVQNPPGTGDDTVAQAEMGVIVERKIEDQLCYSAIDCQTVAEFELMVAKAQRKRVKISKVADLRDEEGDTIKIVHPYTGGTLTVFITNLSRKFKPGTHGNAGYFIDEIEGWIVDMGAVIGFAPPAPPPKPDRDGFAGSPSMSPSSSPSEAPVEPTPPFVSGASASSENTWGDAFAVYGSDGSSSTKWEAADSAPQWWQFDLGAGNEVAVRQIRIGGGGSSGYDDSGLPVAFTFSGSSTGAFGGEETLLLTASGAWSSAEYTTKSWSFANSTPFRYYRVNISATVSDGSPKFNEIEMYAVSGSDGYSLNVLPASGGTATADSELNSSYTAEKATLQSSSYWWLSANTALPHWWKYQFASGKAITKLGMTMPAATYFAPKTFTFEASNTGAFGGEEVTLVTESLASWGASEHKEWEFANTTAYTYYRIHVTEQFYPSQPQVIISSVQMHETVLEITGESVCTDDGS